MVDDYNSPQQLARDERSWDGSIWGAGVGGGGGEGCNRLGWGRMGKWATAEAGRC